MKRTINLATMIATLAGALTILASAAPANAQGARFNYEPNVWKRDSIKRPKRHMGPQHRVSHGSMPKGNVLGLDKSFIKKAQPRMIPASNPMIKSTVAARPIIKKVKPIRGNYKPAFGSPTQKPAPLVAKQPQRMASFGAPRSLAANPHNAIKANKSVQAKLAHPKKVVRKKRRRHHSRRSLHGKLHPPKKMVAHHAHPKIYHNPKLFQPGGHTPQHVKRTTKTKADVYGRIINNF